MKVVQGIFNAIKTGLKTHKWLCVLFVLVIILVISIALKSSQKSVKKEKEDDVALTQDFSSKEGEDNKITSSSVNSPEIDTPVAVNSSTIVTESNESNTTSCYQVTDEDGNAMSITYDKKTRVFTNKARGYSVKIPVGFSVYQGNDTIYIRSDVGNTQYALCYVPGTFSSGTSVWESFGQAYIYRIKAKLKGFNDIEEERILSNYGAGFKVDRTVGNMSCKVEQSEVWFLDEYNNTNIKLMGLNYYSVLGDDGIMMFGVTQDLDAETMQKNMDLIIGSMETYTTNESDKAVDLVEYSSKGSDGVKFLYPSGWQVEEDDVTGMVVIKAPVDASNVYSGMIIEFMTDEKGAYVANHNDFSRKVEGKLLVPTFSQKVAESDFSYQQNVVNADYTAKLGEKPCTVYTITDNMYARSEAVRNSLGFMKNVVNSKRYCFDGSNVPCVMNYFIPNNSEIDTELVEILASNISAP